MAMMKTRDAIKKAAKYNYGGAVKAAKDKLSSARGKTARAVTKAMKSANKTSKVSGKAKQMLMSKRNRGR